MCLIYRSSSKSIVQIMHGHSIAPGGASILFQHRTIGTYWIFQMQPINLNVKRLQHSKHRSDRNFTAHWPVLVSFDLLTGYHKIQILLKLHPKWLSQDKDLHSLKPLHRPSRWKISPNGLGKPRAVDLNETSFLRCDSSWFCRFSKPSGIRHHGWIKGKGFIRRSSHYIVQLIQRCKFAAD